MRSRAAIAMAVILGGLLWPILVMGEEEEQWPAPQAEAVELFGGDVAIPRPTGWRIIRPGQGAAATFRVADGGQAQMEVRVSEGISGLRWERFWKSFDTDLKRVGLELDGTRHARTYGGRVGQFFEYQWEGDEGPFSLVVWHTHEADRAWVFSAFFPTSRRQAYGTTFEEMLAGIEW